MSDRCHLCNSPMPEHSCYRCGNRVCSSCMDENRVLCRRCELVGEAAPEDDEGIEGVKIGYAQLKRVANIPLFVAGIVAIILGMAVLGISFSSLAVPSSSTAPGQLPEPGGFVWVFPLPFVVTWGSPDAVTVIPLMIAVLALPVILMILMLRRFTRLGHL